MLGDGTKKNFKAMLSGAKLPEKLVTVCLRGDLAADFERLEVDLEQVRGIQSNSLEGNGEAEILDKMDTLRTQMLDESYDVVMRAKPRAEWRSLVAEFPPRKTDDGSIDDRDVILGVNVETFFDGIVRACMVDPELNDDDWNDFQKVLTDKQFATLADAAWSVNRSDVDIPFSPAGFRNSRPSAGE